MLLQRPPEPADATIRRSAKRYSTRALSVDIVQGTKRCGFGSLIDISAGGAAFKAYTRLQVGEEYTIIIEKLGNYSATLVRSFDIMKYGVRFQISENERRNLAKEIEKLVEEGNTAS